MILIEVAMIEHFFKYYEKNDASPEIQWYGPTN